MQSLEMYYSHQNGSQVYKITQICLTFKAVLYHNVYNKLHTVYRRQPFNLFDFICNIVTTNSVTSNA
jgi:hypothetical protein